MGITGRLRMPSRIVASKLHGGRSSRQRTGPARARRYFFGTGPGTSGAEGSAA
jgi:hypothetical protein